MKMFGVHSLRLGLCGVALALVAPGSADAASPAYCALYAREYTAQFATGSDADAAVASEYRIQEQAYYQCLNMDIEPAFPETSVYADGGLEDILVGLNTAEDGIAQGDASAEEPIQEAAPEPAPKPKPTQVARRSSRGGSGLEAWTPEWETWCRDHFPNSFDPSDGTVKPFGEARRFCH